MLRKAEDSKTAVVTFLWQGMTISLVATLDRDGGKSLHVMAECVDYARPTVLGRKARWTMRKVGLAHSDAGASTTSDGSVPDATGNDTCT